MRKGIAVVFTVVVVLVVVGLVAPLGMGFIAKGRVASLVQRLSTSPNVQLSLEDYHRGWFSSTAKVTIKISPLVGQNNNYQFVLDAAIKHGPILVESMANGKHSIRLGQALINTNIQMTPEQQAIMDKFFDKSTKPNVVMHTLITLTGAVNTILGVPEFNFTNPALQTNVEWKGLNAEWSVARSLKKISGHVEFGGLTMSSPVMDLMSGTATVEYKEHQAEDGLWVGSGSFDFPRLMIKQNKEGNQFELTGARLSSESSETNNLISSSVDIQFNKLVVNQTTYGPAEYSSTLKNLDARVLAKITDQIRQFSHKESDPSQKQVMLMFLASQAPELLDKGAEFEIKKLNFTMPEGAMSADATVKFSKTDAQNAAKNSPWQRLDAAAHLQAPTDLVKKWLTQMYAAKYRQQLLGQSVAMTPEQINQAAEQAADKQIQVWIDKGIFVTEKNNYKMAVSYNAGQLLVNGKSMSNSTAETTPTGAQPQVGTSAASQPGTAPAATATDASQTAVPGVATQPQATTPATTQSQTTTPAATGTQTTTAPQAAPTPAAAPQQQAAPGTQQPQSWLGHQPAANSNAGTQPSSGAAAAGQYQQGAAAGQNPATAPAATPGQASEDGHAANTTTAAPSTSSAENNVGLLSSMAG